MVDDADAAFNTDVILRVLTKLRDWHKSGRSTPGYVPGRGFDYLAKLTGVSLGRTDIRADIRKITAKHPNLFENLDGPNGWAILNILIVNKDERRDNA